ncbi:MAG: T9SS type A sorting domain-containing protein, partial [Bacteroidota bacterium]|nr:T9SS type A sorting domain-containing protein [Bacteroidota bacterium]MDX5429812.1 T9SS type A sorting domain-containing protein [Bacteroidota bacterium]MDX5468591.1 T9SS type A sorting domain-containing protein [Bacteroidota bacterium]
NSHSSFIAKYDATGKFVCAGTLKAGYMSSAYISTFNVDPSGNIYVGGRFSKTVDFDPSSSEMLLYGDGNGLLTGFVVKLDSNGQGLWAKKLAIEGNPNQATCVDDKGNFYTTVRFYGTIDVDPGPGTALLQAEPNGSIYMMKLNANGDMAWATNYSGNIVPPYFMDVNASGDIYSSGLMRGKVDFDPGPDSFFMAPLVFEDMFIFKLSQGDCDNTMLGINNIQDVNCLSDGLISVHAYGGEAPYTYTWDSAANPLNDSVAAPKKEGIYAVSVRDNRGCERHSSILIKGPKTGSLPELNATLRNSGPMLPGTQTRISLNLTNDVCLESSGTLTLIKDSRVSMVQSVPTPDHVSGDSVSWNFSKLIYLGAPFNPYLIIKPDTNITFNDTLNFRVLAYDAQGDLDSTNNERDYRFNVFAPFDPNDLQVNPGGKCSPAYVMKDQKLTYTVRFQNTGNYKATNVYVQDNLSHDLDISTIKILSKSHPQLAIEVLPGNLVNFRFDNINLPDSTNDEPGSHGFFVFEIAPKPNLPENTVIENRVHIYFDYNEPIITNTVKNTFVSQMPSFNVTQTGATLKASDGAYSYQWVDCTDNNKPISGADQMTYTPTKSGSYAVRVNMKHCDMVSECFTIQLSGARNLFQQQTRVYPNPGSGELFISLSKEYARVEVKICDMQGRQVLKYIGEGQNFTLSPETKPGIYLVSVHTNEGVAVFKVVRN